MAALCGDGLVCLPPLSLHHLRQRSRQRAGKRAGQRAGQRARMCIFLSLLLLYASHTAGCGGRVGRCGGGAAWGRIIGGRSGAESNGAVGAAAGVQRDHFPAR
eukprot:COSAG02_NODE_1054_length_14930_cov_2157.848291_15_plen_103_part_00